MARLVNHCRFLQTQIQLACGHQCGFRSDIRFKDWYEEAKEIFSDLPVLCVSINAAMETLKEHDRARVDRVPGHSIGLYMQMYKDIPFNQKMNSGELIPDEEAKLVLDKL